MQSWSYILQRILLLPKLKLSRLLQFKKGERTFSSTILDSLANVFARHDIINSWIKITYDNSCWLVASYSSAKSSRQVGVKIEFLPRNQNTDSFASWQRSLQKVFAFGLYFVYHLMKKKILRSFQLRSVPLLLLTYWQLSKDFYTTLIYFISSNSKTLLDS